MRPSAKGVGDSLTSPHLIVQTYGLAEHGYVREAPTGVDSPGTAQSCPHAHATSVRQCFVERR